MSPKELVHAAMTQSRPPAIPVMCQLANGHIVINTQTHPIDYHMDDEIWANALLQIRELYDFDGILCHKPGRDHGILDMAEKIDRDADIPTIYLNDGSRIECTRDDDIYYKKNDDFKHPTLNDIDVDKPLDWAPDSYKAFQRAKATFDYNTPEEIPESVFGTIDRVIAAVGDTHSVHGEVRAPFDHFMNMLGMEDGLMALLDNPEKAQALLQRMTKWSVALAVALTRRGAHAVKISSPFAGMGFLSTDMYSEFILPCERQIAEAVTAEGGFTYTHTCGAIGDRLDLIADCKVNGIECLDPPPLGNVDLKEAVDLLKGKLFLKGNVDPVNTLLRGDLDQVHNDISEILNTAGHNMDGFILSSACSVAPPVAPENVKRMVQTCREFTPEYAN